MGDYKEKHGKTRLGDFIESVGGGALDIVNDIASGKDPISAIIGAVTGGSLSPENAEIAFKYHQEDLKDVQNARDNETARDVSANSSFLSKNIHEMIAIIVTGSWVTSWWIPAIVESADVKDVVLIIMGYLFGRSRPE